MRLTLDEKKEIIELLKTGKYKQNEIARMYDCSHCTVSNLKTNGIHINTRTELTREQVLDIVSEFKKTRDKSGLSKKYNVTTATIYNIVNGLTHNEFTGIASQKMKVEAERMERQGKFKKLDLIIKKYL
jgi:DNA invertase Pin-like site-specific DNA recombinase